MNACAKEGPEKGASVAWWLAGCPEGRALLESDEMLRKQFSTCEMNACLIEGPNKGISVASLIASDLKDLTLINSLIILNPALDLNEDKNITKENKTKLREIKNRLKLSIERAYVGAKSASVKGELYDEIFVHIFDDVFFGEYPKLRCIKPILNNNSNWRADLCQSLGIDVSKAMSLKKCYATNTVSFWSRKNQTNSAHKAFQNKLDYAIAVRGNVKHGYNAGQPPRDLKEIQRRFDAIDINSTGDHQHFLQLIVKMKGKHHPLTTAAKELNKAVSHISRSNVEVSLECENETSAVGMQIKN